ncbi:unnamed protein product [Arabidopsis halleri]
MNPFYNDGSVHSQVNIGQRKMDGVLLVVDYRSCINLCIDMK